MVNSLTDSLGTQTNLNTNTKRSQGLRAIGPSVSSACLLKVNKARCLRYFQKYRVWSASLHGQRKAPWVWLPPGGQVENLQCTWSPEHLEPGGCLLGARRGSPGGLQTFSGG